MNETWAAVGAGLLSGLAGTGVTLFLTLRNHRSIHAWNEKYQVYSEVIQNLTTIVTYSGNKAASVWGDYPSPSDEEKMDCERAFSKLHEVRTMAGWVLRRDVAQILEDHLPDRDKFTPEDFGGWDNCTYAEHCHVQRCYQTQLELIIPIARQDLGFGESIWRRVWRWMQEELSLDWSADATVREVPFREDCAVCNPRRSRSRKPTS